MRSDDITKDPRYGHNSPHKGMPQGHLPVVSYLAVPVISKSGEVIGGLFFGHPKPAMFSVQHENLVLSIAAQAAIALDNSRLFEQVKSLSDKKDEFIALASHELRTPMTTIKGYLQVLSRQDLPAMNKLFVERSLNQINKLNSLVEDMLQMSKIEAGKLEFNSELFDLRQMLAEMAHTFGYSYPSHQLITTLPDLKITISGDPQRIEQALVNLLNNAVKYSPKADKVYLTLELQDDQAIVKVRDLGIGLSKDQQKNIFSRFYRAENTKGISGLGLGLYLTKQIIDRHHGTITFESAEGRGSEFSFILPVNR
ncbi:Sensor histidine kinase YycG [compost metagenome]